jgi:SET domain-containing protein
MAKASKAAEKKTPAKPAKKAVPKKATAKPTPEQAAPKKATPKKATPKKVSKKAAPKKVVAKAADAKSTNPPLRSVVRRSPIHGRGVFAKVDIPKGERVIEYKARKITWAQADRWYADDESKPSHTFLFTLDDQYVLDGNKDANSARWINHSCNPNCESDIVDGRIWIESIRNIKAGEELFYDYNITLETPHTPAEKRRWGCRCGAKNCRGTLLGKKR